MNNSDLIREFEFAHFSVHGKVPNIEVYKTNYFIIRIDDDETFKRLTQICKIEDLEHIIANLWHIFTTRVRKNLRNDRTKEILHQLATVDISTVIRNNSQQ